MIPPRRSVAPGPDSHRLAELQAKGWAVVTSLDAGAVATYFAELEGHRPAGEFAHATVDAAWAYADFVDAGGGS